MARCDPEKTASRKLPEKIGYTREGNPREIGIIHKDEKGNPIWSDAYEYSKITGKEYPWACNMRLRMTAGFFSVSVTCTCYEAAIFRVNCRRLNGVVMREYHGESIHTGDV
jgi:hypothetical protein